MKATLIILTCFWALGAETPNQRPVVKQGFNGFPWGTLADSIVHKVGLKPQKRDKIGLAYENTHYEGVLASKVVYSLAEGKLKGGSYFKVNARKSAYDSLYVIYSNRYSPPTRRAAGVTFWKAGYTEVSLLRGEGTIMANVLLKSPTR